MFFLLFACVTDPKVGDSVSQESVVSSDDSSADFVDQDGDGFLARVDCNDTDGAVHPGAVEQDGDGVDSDCDGEDDNSSGTPGTDADGDGYLASVDCDDTDAAVHPGATEHNGDAVDSNCDGSNDSSSGNTGTDADGDGYLASVDCNDSNAAIHPGATERDGDGVDSDCDGQDSASNPADADGDGYASSAYHGTDCNDASAAIHPDASETRGDNVDSDCDGADFGTTALVAGDLVITEIMYDPDAVGDGEGEYFEVYNGTGHTVNLAGLVVADDTAFGAADIFVVEEDLVAAVGDRLVFGVSADTTINGGITVDYDFPGGGVNFNNAADDLYLGIPHGAGYTTIDSVSYDELASWPIAKGFSIELKDTQLTATANDSASNWCLATSVAGSTTDMGSPGAVSSGC